MFAKIKKISLTISTISFIGNYRWGFVVASLLGIPVAYILDLIYKATPNFAHFLCVFLVMFFILVIHFASLAKFENYSVRDTDSIIINDTAGVFIALTGSLLSYKFIIVGFILYHILRYCIPILLEKSSFNFRLTNLPGALGLLSCSTVSGIGVNLFFSLVSWLVK